MSTAPLHQHKAVTLLDLPEPDQLEVAWAAGFFDGEGNARFDSRSGEGAYPRIQVSIAQTSREQLDRFQRAVRVGRVGGPYRPKTPKSRPYWQWTVEGYEVAIHVFDVLRPYLCSDKTAAFVSAIAAVEAWRSNPVCGRGHTGLKLDSRKHYYCPTCRYGSTKKARETRWEVARCAS